MNHRFDDGPFLTLAEYAERVEGPANAPNNLWKTWADFDDDGGNDRTIIGIGTGVPVFVTCEGIPQQWAEAFCEALNRQQFTITLATTKE